MKVEELRLGNYVYGSQKKDVGKVISIRESGLVVIELPSKHSDYYGQEVLNGIPLTEEWLLRLKFISEKGNSFKRDLLSIHIYENRITVYIYIHYMATIKIQYVHQLQNLYHALTGEELKLKEV